MVKCSGVKPNDYDDAQLQYYLVKSPSAKASVWVWVVESWRRILTWAFAHVLFLFFLGRSIIDQFHSGKRCKIRSCEVEQKSHARNQHSHPGLCNRLPPNSDCVAKQAANRFQWRCIVVGCASHISVSLSFFSARFFTIKLSLD